MASVSTMIYLDYNATSPIRAEVIAAMREAMEDFGNPSSIHAAGRKARKTIEVAREKIATIIHASPQQLIFTSGGTEANNMALRCSGRSRVLISAIEHDSIRFARKDAEIIPVDAQGVLDLGALEKMLAASDTPALVSVMLANNETGAIQPIEKIAALTKKSGALLHCDAAQGFGKVPINYAALGADMMTLSAHKAGGPQGIGVLVFNDAVPLAALMTGGGQERSRRAGTENVAAIAGFGVLADLLRDMPHETAHMERLRNKLESGLRQLGCEIFAQNANRLPNTTAFSKAGLPSELQVMKLDMMGFAVSSGSACSSGKVRASHVLQAMQAAPDLVNAALRVSLGWKTTPQEIDLFLDAYDAMRGITGNKDFKLAAEAA